MTHGDDPRLLTRQETLDALGVVLGGSERPVRGVRPDPPGPGRVLTFVPRPATASPPRRRWGRPRRWASVAAAAVGLGVIAAPAIGAGLERLGHTQAAAIVRTVPAALYATVHKTTGRTRSQAVRTVVTERRVPVLLVSPPDGRQISGTLTNVRHADVVLVAYLYVDPWLAQTRGCHATHWYGSKPVAGQTHRLSLSGTWSLTWQSSLSSTRICDGLASQIAVFVVPADFTPPALLTEEGNEALPERLFRAALAVEIVERQMF